MPCLLLIVSHYLIEFVDANSHTEWQTMNPDQLTSSEVSWSRSTLFAKAGHIQIQHRKPNFYDTLVFCVVNGKQCKPWSDAAFCSIWSWSALFAKVQFWSIKHKCMNNTISLILVIQQVSIPADLEKKILAVITTAFNERQIEKEVSGRLTSKKLLVWYYYS